MSQPNTGKDDNLSIVNEDVSTHSPHPSFVPTKTAPMSTMALDTSNLNEKDLQLLKNQDAFLYYSIPIPSVRHSAVIHFLDIDVLDSHVQGQGSHKVERQSRISFECPADILMEDLMEDLLNDDMKGPGDDNDLDSILNKLLEDNRGVA